MPSNPNAHHPGSSLANRLIDRGPARQQRVAVYESISPPLLLTLRWLTAHAGFPAARLPERAELLVLIATAAADEDREARSRVSTKPLVDRGFTANVRNYTIQRRRVHFKCDNSAKV
jgi:hypothetical protein